MVIVIQLGTILVVEVEHLSQKEHINLLLMVGILYYLLLVVVAVAAWGRQRPDGENAKKLGSHDACAYATPDSAQRESSIPTPSSSNAAAVGDRLRWNTPHIVQRAQCHETRGGSARRSV